MKATHIAAMVGCVLFAAVPASATLFSAVIKAAVDSSFDNGTFGSSGGGLNGKTATIRLTYELPSLVGSAYGGPDYGPALAGANPIRSFSLTINAVTHDIDFSGRGWVSYQVPGQASRPGDFIVQVARDGSGTEYVNLGALALTYGPVANGVPVSGYGNVTFKHGGAYGWLTPTSLRISGAVPEPATWAMMAGGFALVGTGARRRLAAA